MDYEGLLLSGKHSDFIINVKHEKFEAHKLILGARSSVFATILGEKMEKKHKTMAINDADPEIFLQFLLYIYTGDEEHLDWKNIVELYKMGDKYCVEDLKELCVERMKTNISVENVFEIFMLSQQIDDSELSAITIQFFFENSNEIFERESYVEFMKDYPDESYVLIKALVADK